MVDDVKKIYETKAISSLVISRSTYTRPLNTLKEQCTVQNRSALEFCVWFDYKLVEVAELEETIFNCILKLIEKKHITNGSYMKNFRLACILLQKFVLSDHTSNLLKIEDFLQDYPQYSKCIDIKPKEVPLDFDKIFEYDRVLANKRIFPYFFNNAVSKELVAELISRNLLAFDTRFHNLIYICKSENQFLGIEKRGIGTKHYQQLIYKDKPVAFMYYADRLRFVDFKRDICKAIFFDDTLNMLKYLSENYICEYTLYCSLHTAGCDIDTYTNTLALLNTNVAIDFCFINNDLISKLKDYEVNKSCIDTVDILKNYQDNLPSEIDGDKEECIDNDLPF